MPLSTTTCVNAAACLIILSTASVTPTSHNSKPKLLPFPFHEPRGLEKQEHFEDISVDTDEKFRDRCFVFIGEVFPGKTKTGEVTSKEDDIDLANKIIPLCKDPSQPRCSLWARDLVSTRDADQHREWCDEMLVVSKEWQTEGIPTASREHWRRVHAESTGVGEVAHDAVAISTAAPVGHDVYEVAERTELQAVNLDAVSKKLDDVANAVAKRKAKAAARAAAKGSATTAAPATAAPILEVTAAEKAAAEKASEASAEAVAEKAAAEAAAEQAAEHYAAAAATTTAPSSAEVDSELDTLGNDLGSLDHKLVKIKGSAATAPAPQIRDVSQSFQNASSKVAAEHALSKSAETHHAEQKHAKTEAPAKVAKVTAAPDVDHELEAMDHLLDGVDSKLKKVKSESVVHEAPSPVVLEPKPTIAKVASVDSTKAPPAKVASVSPVQDKPLNDLKSFGGKTTEVQKFLTPVKAPDVDKELDAVTHDLDSVDHKLYSVSKADKSQLKAFGVVGVVPSMSATKVASPEIPVARAPSRSVAAVVHAPKPSSADEHESKTSRKLITPLQPQAEPHADLASAALKEEDRDNCECNVREGQKVCRCRKGDQVWTTSSKEPNQVLAPQAKATHVAVQTSWFSNLFR